MAKSRGRKFAEITTPTNGVFDIASVPTITNAKLQNSAMTLAGSSVSLGGTGVADTDALSEGSSNLYFTDARVQTFLGGGTLAGNIVVPDNRSIYLGSNSDVRIYHDTTNTQLINATGALQITSNGGFAVTGAATFSSTITATGNIIGTLGTAAQTNITSLGTLTSLTVDTMTLNTGTISSTASNFILDAAGELHLDADDGIIRIRVGGGDYGMFQISNSDFIIRSMVGDKDLIFKGNDGGSVITALTLDMSTGGTAYFADDIRLTDNHAVRLGTHGDIVFYHDNSNGFLESAGNFTLDVSGNILLDSDAGVVQLRDAGTVFYQLAKSSDNVRLTSFIQDGDLQFRGNDGGSYFTALTLDMSAAGAATFNSSVTAADLLKVSTNGSSAAEVDIVSGATWTVRSNPTSGTNSYGLDIIKGSAGTDVKMSIDSSGRLLVGKSATGIGTAGIELTHDNVILGTRSGGIAQYLNRLSSDGEILQFMKDGTSVGAISAKSGDLAIHSTTTNHVGLVFGNTRIEPANNYGTTSHNTVDLGNTDRGFKNLYLTSAIRWYVSGAQKAYHVYDGTNMMNYGASGVGHEWYAGGSRAMLLNSSGNLDIGMPSGYNAEGRLHVYKGASGKSYAADGADQLILENSNSVMIDIRTPSGNTGGILFSDNNARGRGIIQYAHSSDDMYFYSAAGVTMRLNSSNHVIMGTASHADDVLYVQRSNAGKLIRLFEGNTERGWISNHPGQGLFVYNTIKINSTGTNLYQVASGGGNADLRYHTGNNSVTYDTSSEQFKKNIRDNNTYGLTAVKALKSRMFEYKDDDRTDVGLIAEEVVTVVPELVGLDDEGNPLTVDYKRFVSVLVKAMQEQQEMIEALQTEVAALKGG